MRLRAPTWILVADASRARLFSKDRIAKNGLHELKVYSHPESRAKNLELVTDRPGRMAQSSAGNGHGPGAGGAHGARSGMEPDMTPKEVEHELFARELCADLLRGLSDHAYDDLVLVANPQFLGTLRQVVDTQVQKRVSATVDKDYTMLKPQELEEHLAEHLPGH